MPVLAQLQSEYQDQGFRVVAVNIVSNNYSLADWTTFLNQFEPKDQSDFAERAAVQDVKGQAIRQYELTTLGTEMIVDRQGRITFRSDGSTGTKKLRAEIEKVL